MVFFGLTVTTSFPPVSCAFSLTALTVSSTFEDGFSENKVVVEDI